MRTNLILPLIILCLICSEPCYAYFGTVTHVSKGDLLKVTAEGVVQDVRLYGVMCPVKGQPFYEDALVLTKFLANLKTVDITPLFKDSDGITNALVRVQGSKEYLNNQLVSHGLAWIKPVECKARMCVEWKKLEELAQKNGIGLWGDSPAIPPWEWQKAERMDIRNRSQEKQ